MNIIYDENPSNILNQKISEAFKTAYGQFDDFKKVCREIYEIGVLDGQKFVWDLRGGKFKDKNEEDPVLENLVTVSGGGTVTFKIDKDGKLIQEDKK